MKTCPPSAFLVLFSGVMCGLAVAAPLSTPAPQTEIPAPKAPAYEAVRAALFLHLEKQAGAKAEIPAFPTEKLLRWIDERNASVAKTDQARYALLFEHLLIAQKLLHERDEKSRRLGLHIASESAHFAAAQLPTDKWLAARIYDGFLLPHIALASAQAGQDPSRQRLLEAAVSAFDDAGERAKQVSVLEWLLSLPAKPQTLTPNALILDPNTRDWARGVRASLLFEAPNAPRADIKRALSLLQAIESPDMTGFQGLQKRIEARLKSLPAPPKAAPKTDRILSP